jgi:hypothetical protein
MSSSFTLIRVDNRPYCAGLFWYPLDTDKPTTAGQMDALLSEQSAAFFVTRGRPAIQVGLVGLDAQATQGLVSIAAMVADTLTRSGMRSFLVAMPTDEPERWCYIAQNQGLLQFDGDMVGDAQKVRARIEADLDTGVNWDLIVAPADWAVPGAQQWKREQLLPHRRILLTGAFDARLRAVRPDGQIEESGLSLTGLAMMSMVLLGAAMAGGAYWFSYKHDEHLRTLAAANAQEQNTFMQERPWLNKPSLHDWGRRCLDAMTAQTLDVAGWRVVELSCQPASGSLIVRWERTPGALLDDLLAQRPKARLIKVPQEPARVSWTLPLSPVGSARLPVSPGELMRKTDWELQLSHWNEQWREQRPVFVMGTESAGTTPIRWTWADNVPPLGALPALDLPGTVLESLEYSGAAKGPSTWTMKASHHVRK